MAVKLVRLVGEYIEDQKELTVLLVKRDDRGQFYKKQHSFLLFFNLCLFICLRLPGINLKVC